MTKSGYFMKWPALKSVLSAVVLKESVIARSGSKMDLTSRQIAVLDVIKTSGKRVGIRYVFAEMPIRATMVELKSDIKTLIVFGMLREHRDLKNGNVAFSFVSDIFTKDSKTLEGTLSLQKRILAIGKRNQKSAEKKKEDSIKLLDYKIPHLESGFGYKATGKVFHKSEYKKGMILKKSASDAIIPKKDFLCHQRVCGASGDFGEVFQLELF